MTHPLLVSDVSIRVIPVKSAGTVMTVPVRELLLLLMIPLEVTMPWFCADVDVDLAVLMLMGPRVDVCSTLELTVSVSVPVSGGGSDIEFVGNCKFVEVSAVVWFTGDSVKLELDVLMGEELESVISSLEEDGVALGLAVSKVNLDQIMVSFQPEWPVEVKPLSVVSTVVELGISKVPLVRADSSEEKGLFKAE